MSKEKKSIFEGPIEIPIDQIDYDPHNMRFGHVGFEMSQKQIEEYLMDEEDSRTLKKQIIRDKQVFHPIFVRKIGDRYVATDGNRRTVSTKSLDRDIKAGKLKGFEQNHFATIKAFVLRGTDREIDLFLGSTHVSGTKPWANANKANHIYNLIEKHNETIESVAEELGTTKGKVETAYYAFKATERYGKKFGGLYIRKFAYFDEFYRQKLLKEWEKDNPSNLDWFMNLVDENKINFDRGVRKFAKIIGAENPHRAQALAVLKSEKGNITDAFVIVANTSDEKCWNEIYRALEVLKAFPHQALLDATSNTEKLQSLSELIVVATDLQRTIQDMQQKTSISA